MNPRPEDGLHLADYAATVWQRRWLAFLVFALVVGGVATRAMLSTPVYRSEATLQLEGKPQPGGLLGELQAMQNASSTDAEMEIMRSRAVAEGAARQLSPEDLLFEQYAYRPMDLLLSRVMGPRPGVRLSVETDPVADGRPAETYTFEFGGEGELAVTREIEQSKEEAPVPGFRSGQPFDVFGRRFVLAVDGNPDGRTYVLTLRSPVDTALWIQEGVSVQEVGRMTGIVKLGFEGPTPQFARRVAQALTDSYLALKRIHKREQARSALDFLREETDRVHQKLTESEAALDRERSELNAVLLSDRARWIVEKTSALDLERAQRRVLLNEQKSLLARISEGDDPANVLMGLGGGTADPMTEALAGQIAALETRLQGLVSAGVMSEYPERREVEAQIAAARRRLKDGMLQLVQGRIGETTSELEHLDQTIRSYEEEAKNLPQTERKLAELGREAKGNLEIYSFLVQKQQEAQIALASTLADVRAIDLPIEPTMRRSPKLLLQTLLAVVLGIVAAVCVVLFAEYLDRSIKGPEALEEGTGLSLFAAIPDFAASRRGSLRGYRGTLITRDHPNSGPAEAYRTLRTNLRFATMEREVKTLAITSALMGEGKTVTNCNLAITCALHGEDVILLDLDLRRPNVHRQFGLDQTPGMAEWLAGKVEWASIVRECGVERLSIVTAGSTTENPAALIESERVDELLASLRERYGRVLVDVPPVLAVADAATLLPRLDGVLLLTREKYCRMPAVCEARDRIRRTGANLLGSVYNAFSPQTASARGYGRYGYYGYYEGDAAKDAASRARRGTRPAESGRTRT